jgi:hypothetical protein
LAGSGRRIYVFIDRAVGESEAINNEVLQIAEHFQSLMEIMILRAPFNYGVKSAVPEAINWIAQYEDEFIVLEDDCHLNESGFKFFDEHIAVVRDDIAIICGTSPWDLNPAIKTIQNLSFSKYPLISGWATSAQQWRRISYLIEQPPPYRLSLQKVLNQPNLLIPVCFFLAAHIRVNKHKLQAWDCSVALAMLISGLFSLIPNVTMVTNTGRDEVAEHTVPKEGEDNIFRAASTEFPSDKIDYNLKPNLNTDKEIESELYGMRGRHALSPFKAYFF